MTKKVKKFDLKKQKSVICLSIGGGQQFWAGDLDIVISLDLML